MASVVTPKVYSVGHLPLNLVRNGMDVASPTGTKLAAMINMIAGRRKKVLGAWSSALSSVPGVAGGNSFFWGAFRTSPEVEAVEAVMVCAPGATASSSDAPGAEWVLQEIAAGPPAAITQPRFKVGKRRTTTPQPSDLFVIRQRWDGKGGTTKPGANKEYLVRLDGYGSARVLSATLFEVPQERLFRAKTDPTADNCVDPGRFSVGAPITVKPVKDLQDTALTLWKRQGANLFTWGAPDPSSSFQTTGSTYVNIWDTSFTDWNTNAPGMQVRPRYRGTRNSDNVPVIFAVRASAGGSTATVAFRTQAGVDLATISVTVGGGSPVASYFTVTANLDASQASQKIDVLAKAGTTGIPTLTITNVACFEYEA